MAAVSGGAFFGKVAESDVLGIFDVGTPGGCDVICSTFVCMAGVSATEIGFDSIGEGALKETSR
jgi:hypothetical protein